MAKRNEARWEHWRSVLSEQSTSGLSVAEFCRRHSISPPAFYNWRRKLESQQQGATVNAFVPVTLPPVSLTDACFELQLGSGMTLRIPMGCDEAALKRVLRAAVSLESSDA